MTSASGTAVQKETQQLCVGMAVLNIARRDPPSKETVRKFYRNGHEKPKKSGFFKVSAKSNVISTRSGAAQM